MAKQKDPQDYTINGIAIVCPVCQHDRFWEGKAQLNTAVATFFKLDWTNEEVMTLTCDKCSHILWFNQSPS